MKILGNIISSTNGNKYVCGIQLLWDADASAKRLKREMIDKFFFLVERL